MSAKNGWCKYCGRMRSIHCESEADLKSNADRDDMCKGPLLELQYERALEQKQP